MKFWHRNEDDGAKFSVKYDTIRPELSGAGGPAAKYDGMREAEYAQLASEKAKFYEQYKEAKEELLKLKTAKQNVASFFREEEQTQQER